MQFRFVWTDPIVLSDATNAGMIYSLPNTKVPSGAGLYIFGRKFGKRVEALYVGKAGNIQKRTQQQLKNLKLMLHLQNSRAGSKVLIAGELKTTSASRVEQLPLLEKAFIRHFLLEGHELVNIQGTRILRHEVSSSGSPHVPETMFIE